MTDNSVFFVICEDDKVRHNQSFSTLCEATRFAHWGHICTARHRYVQLRITKWRIRNEDQPWSDWVYAE